VGRLFKVKKIRSSLGGTVGVWHCHCCGLGHICDVGLLFWPWNFTCHRYGKKKKKKKKGRKIKKIQNQHY